MLPADLKLWGLDYNWKMNISYDSYKFNQIYLLTINKGTKWPHWLFTLEPGTLHKFRIFTNRLKMHWGCCLFFYPFQAQLLSGTQIDVCINGELCQLCGHVPISLIKAWITVTCASGSILGNEIRLSNDNRLVFCEIEIFACRKLSFHQNFNQVYTKSRRMEIINETLITKNCLRKVKWENKNAYVGTIFRVRLLSKIFLR